MGLLFAVWNAQGSRQQPAHERSNGVLLFKDAASDREPSLPAKKQAQNIWGIIPRQRVTTPVCIWQIWCHMEF